MSAALLWTVAVVVGIWAQRTWRARRREARFRRRFPAGPDGIVLGAEPRTYEAAGRGALLLVHGYNDSPRSLERIAQALHAVGWTVRLPLLPGHGRSLEAWDDWTADQAIALLREEYEALRRSHGVVVVGGLSMGGALATWLAAEAEPDAVLLFAPMLFVPRPMQLAVSTARIWSLVTKYLAGGGGRSIRDPEARDTQISYGCSTRRSLEAVERIARGTVVRLGFVHAPVLFLQSEEDNRLPADQSRHALARLGSADRTAVWTTGAGHVLTVDYGWQALAERVAQWLTARFPALD
ncbi:MAG: alpha/beta fold hydrolase [Gemmatimonadaceae bacterium]|nr:alpha/beta fold hydrolase [Gemmatimonadaceae bacterium]